MSAGAFDMGIRTLRTSAIGRVTLALLAVGLIALAWMECSRVDGAQPATPTTKSIHAAHAQSGVVECIQEKADVGAPLRRATPEFALVVRSDDGTVLTGATMQRADQANHGEVLGRSDSAGRIVVQAALCGNAVVVTHAGFGPAFLCIPTDGLDHEVFLSRGAGVTVQVTVDGRPAPGVDVVIASGKGRSDVTEKRDQVLPVEFGGMVRWGVTGESGKTEFSGLPDGAYWVRAPRSGYLSREATRSFDVPEVSEVTVNLVRGWGVAMDLEELPMDCLLRPNSLVVSAHTLNQAMPYFPTADYCIGGFLPPGVEQETVELTYTGTKSGHRMVVAGRLQPLDRLVAERPRLIAREFVGIPGDLLVTVVEEGRQIDGVRILVNRMGGSKRPPAVAMAGESKKLMAGTYSAFGDGYVEDIAFEPSEVVLADGAHAETVGTVAPGYHLVKLDIPIGRRDPDAHVAAIACGDKKIVEPLASLGWMTLPEEDLTIRVTVAGREVLSRRYAWSDWRVRAGGAILVE